MCGREDHGGIEILPVGHTEIPQLGSSMVSASGRHSGQSVERGTQLHAGIERRSRSGWGGEIIQRRGLEIGGKRVETHQGNGWIWHKRLELLGMLLLVLALLLLLLLLLLKLLVLLELLAKLFLLELTLALL